MIHRGPDDHGSWLDPDLPLALGHRRLAIQDLSTTGRQPMVSSCGRFHIVYNGEIYNFKLIAHDLRKLGYTFRGASDTEVLLEGFTAWGIAETLKRSRGMFAMAVWDRQSRELVICRDRMGEKPLFFGWLRGCLVFASELKAIREVFRNSLQIDMNALAPFFRYGYVPTPHCIYRHLYKLLPSTFLRIPLDPMPDPAGFQPFPGSKGRFCPESFWQLDEVARAGLDTPILDEQEAFERFDKSLRETLTLQKIADVPLGAFLSGGVDSSLVCAMLQAVSTRPVRTLAIGFKEKEFAEAPYAQAIENIWARSIMSIMFPPATVWP